MVEVAKTGMVKTEAKLENYMIREIAKSQNSALGPEDLSVLQTVLLRVCELRGDNPQSPQAEKHAKILISLYQSGIRNRHQLVAMLTGRKFP